MRSPEAVAPEFVAKVEAGRLIAQVIFYVIVTYDRNLLQSETMISLEWMHMRFDFIFVHTFYYFVFLCFTQRSRSQGDQRGGRHQCAIRTTILVQR